MFVLIFTSIFILNLDFFYYSDSDVSLSALFTLSEEYAVLSISKFDYSNILFLILFSTRLFTL